MVTGVWSKHIEAANERHGTPGFALGAASIVLFAVTGLGFRLKLKLLRSVLSEFKDVLSGKAMWGPAPRIRRYAQNGRRDHTFRQARDTSDERREEAWRHAEEQRRRFEEQRRASSGEPGGGRHHHRGPTVDSETALERHRAALGVRRGCSRADLKAAYYRQAKLLHPDASGVGGSAPNSGEDFARLKAAYDALDASLSSSSHSRAMR
jgi:hypothetical protein